MHIRRPSDDVKERLNQMAEREARLVSVDRKVKKGDTAVIDFEGFDNGVAFEGGKGENHELEIGSGSFVPGFEDQIIGMKAGEEKDIDITFPENYTKDLAGKQVVFHVKVNEVKEKQTPALDDEPRTFPSLRRSRSSRTTPRPRSRPSVSSLPRSPLRTLCSRRSPATSRPISPRS